jgi:hypothetical protein
LQLKNALAEDEVQLGLRALIKDEIASTSMATLRGGISKPNNLNKEVKVNE